MNKLLILVILLAAVFFAYPLVNEAATSPCVALERRALTLAAQDGGAQGVIIASLARQLLQNGKGRVAAELSRQHNPDIPVPLSCTVNYWHSMFDRAWLARAVSRMVN